MFIHGCDLLLFIHLLKFRHGRIETAKSDLGWNITMDIFPDGFSVSFCVIFDCINCDLWMFAHLRVPGWYCFNRSQVHLIKIAGGLWSVLAIYYFQLMCGTLEYRAILIRAIVFQYKPVPGVYHLLEFEKRTINSHLCRITIPSRKSFTWSNTSAIHRKGFSRIASHRAIPRKLLCSTDTHIGWQTDIPITQHKFELTLNSDLKPS